MVCVARANHVARLSFSHQRPICVGPPLPVNPARSAQHPLDALPHAPAPVSADERIRVLELALDAHEGVNRTIGPYKLLQQIGEGGFGIVWMAEQQTPVCRRVALKIIKSGMDTHEVITRFEAERQASRCDRRVP